MPAQKKVILSEDFIRRIFEFSGGYLDNDKLKKLFSLIEDEASSHCFTRSAESNLLRFISAVYDKVSFLTDCLRYPHYIELLVSITFNSNYLTDILVRNPEYFYTIANPSYLEKKISRMDFEVAADSAISSFQSFASRVNALRRFKRKEILRIGAKDIFLKHDLEEITLELSYLAKSIASRLFSICYNYILDKNHLILSENRYCLISLGKLGGDELNYSSDIDLIIFYDENETLTNKKEFQEILTEAVLLFIESASSITGSGYIYRIDFRLRPDGKNSPLCRRLTDYLTYYESRGEDWERQMLIKSSFVSGNRKLFRKFKEFLTPFIYPASFKSSPVDQIRRLKNNIENNLNSYENIKLVSGGIRDIEFSVQALQLLNGGKIESLRTANTLNVLQELQKNRLLTESEAEILKDSYVFYRRIEHYLQLMNDTQTHLIPSKGELLDKLSFYLGFKNTKGFLEEVDQNRKRILKIYQSVTGKDEPLHSGNTIVDIIFSNPKEAERDLQYLREGKGLLGNKEFDKHSVEAFTKISAQLNKYLKNSGDPDLVLKNFVRVIKQAKFPSIWYDDFREHRFFNAFLAVCEFSQSSVDIFAENKELRELFLSRRIFDKISKMSELTHDEFIFLLMVQFTIGLIKYNKVPVLLSRYLRTRISQMSELLDDDPELRDHYFIGAMGSFGSGEMTFASDIDLIFITDNLKHNPGEQKVFLALLDKLRDEFKPAAVDCRLRPEGKSAMLVWDINAYMKYISSRARTWELQAFTKLAFISGNKNLFNRIIRSVIKRLKTEDAERIKSDLKEMRKKMLPPSGGISEMINLKKSAGGTTDIEFILQYLILCNPLLYQKLRAKNVKATSEGIIRFAPEYSNDLTRLKMNHRFIKSLILHNQNIFHQSGSLIVRDESRFGKLAERMKYESGSELEKKLLQVMKDNSSLFKKLFE